MSQQDGPCFSIDDVDVIEDTSVYDGFYSLKRYKLRHRLIKGGWSKPLVRECLHRPAAVAVLLYDPHQDNVVLLEQFRIGALDAPEGPWQLELVAGLIEPGESPEDVAHRESLEEAGAEIMELEFMFDFYSSAGGSNEKIALYCGGIDSTGLGGVHGLKEEGEDIWAQVFPRTEAITALTENHINNATAIIALQWLGIHWRRLQELWQ